MPKRNEFVDYLLELLQPFGHVTSRAMFGGHGIYKDGLIFGLVIDEAFYLKVDDVNRGEFDERGLRPFVYQSKSKGMEVSLGYYQCPEEALESAAVMQDWARSAYAAALRKAAMKNTTGKRTSRDRKP